MSARSLILVAALALGSPVIAPLSFAQELTQPDVENSKNAFTGVVNANSVYVRSGPGENYYATLKLDKGATITVVGIKFEWLKVSPPEGSFCYVAKAYVEKRGDGTLGRVTRPELPARVGSSLNAMKYAVSAKLNQGDDVKIIGEEDEYFKIAPPPGAALYINKKYVDPGKPVATPAPEVTKAAPATPTDQTGAIANIEAPPTANNNANPLIAEATAAPGTPTDTAIAPTTQPGDASAAAPATQPAPEVVQASFEKLEATYASATGKPIDQQPIDELLTGYESLKSAQLPATFLRIVEQRIATLKMRTEARTEFLAAMKQQEEANKRAMSLKAEREELEQRIKENDVKVFTAVGQLQASSLQTGRGTLYRLTDPATGRTIVYIRSDDAKLVSQIGQFVGVKGAVVTEPTSNLRTITPTAFEPVDPNLVGTKVAAQLIPQSLLAKSASLNAAE